MRAPKDLIIVVADNNMASIVKGLLGRCAALSIREISCDVFVHPQRDPGCLRYVHEFLLAFRNGYRHALVMFDRHGCGKEDLTRIELEGQVEDRLSSSGWGERASAVVLDPELEAWVWSRSPHVDRALGWEQRKPGLRAWLRQNGFLEPNHTKPSRPKAAIEAALSVVKKPRSSAIYGQIAATVSVDGCTDPAFLKFRKTLSNWFSRQI